MTVLFQMLAIWIAAMMESVSVMEMTQRVADPSTERMKYYLLMIQGITSIGGFIISSWIYLRFISGLQLKEMFSDSSTKTNFLLLSALISIVFMIPNSIIIDWNMNIDLPDGPFEDLLRGMEDTVLQLTNFLTEINSFSYYLLAMFVIAVVPGIGEELLFRGLLQNALHGWLKNKHVAIWLAAIAFGVLHFQFYGLVPRVLLGALFGYLYAWSGNLWYPIIAHFMNNGFMVTLIYLYKIGGTSYNIEDEQASPWWLAMLFTFVLVGLLYFFRKRFNENLA